MKLCLLKEDKAAEPVIIKTHSRCRGLRVNRSMKIKFLLLIITLRVGQVWGREEQDLCLRQEIKGKDVSLLRGETAAAVSTFCLSDTKIASLILLDFPRFHLDGAVTPSLPAPRLGIKTIAVLSYRWLRDHLALWREQGGGIPCSYFLLGFCAIIILVFPLCFSCMLAVLTLQFCGQATTVPLVYISYSHWKAILNTSDGQYISKSFFLNTPTIFFSILQGSQNAKSKPSLNKAWCIATKKGSQSVLSCFKP